MASKSVRLYTYARALRSQSDYGDRMRVLSRSIFGEVRRPTDRSSMRIVKMFSRRPYEERPEIVRYYPAHDEMTALMKQLRAYGLYRDEHEDYKDDRERLRRLRGKPREPWRPWAKNKKE